MADNEEYASEQEFESDVEEEEVDEDDDDSLSDGEEVDEDDEENDEEDEDDEEDDDGEENEEEDDNENKKESEEENIDFEHKTEDKQSVYNKLNVIYKDGVIDDPNHKTTPFMTRYEYTNILSARCKMLTHGARPFVQVFEGDNIKDIAKRELKEKKIPFIIQRPIPNGTFEYWRVKDLIPYAE